MPVSTLDAGTALIVVDLQNGIVGYPFVHPIEGVIERTVALLDEFRRRHLPRVLVNVAGGHRGEPNNLGALRLSLKAGPT